MFYDRIYNIPDGAPSKEIIDNDAMLDQWIEKYNLRKKAERTGESKSGAKKSAEQHKHIIRFRPQEGDD